jgi:hypothetical protein
MESTVLLWLDNNFKVNNNYLHSGINSFIKKSCFKYIEFITEDTKVKHTNITTKLNSKLYTKVIKSAKLIGLGSARQSLIKREVWVLKLKAE